MAILKDDLYKNMQNTVVIKFEPVNNNSYFFIQTLKGGHFKGSHLFMKTDANKN